MTVLVASRTKWRLRGKPRVGLMVMPLVVAGLLAAPRAFGNGDDLYLDCPCRLQSDGATLTITVGARSFRSTDSGAVRVRVLVLDEDRPWAYTPIGEAPIAESVGAGARLAGVSLETSLETDEAGLRSLELRLEEQVGELWRRQDGIRMETAVDLSEPFDLGELDYLKDTDGDGVGDINERAEQTDPLDPQSTPGASTIDLLALYSQGFPALFDGDPTTRIQHVVTLANVMFEDSGLAVRLRPVGAAQVEVDEHNERGSPEAEDLAEQVRRHGSDLTVLFRPRAPNAGLCGWSYVGGSGDRGRLSREQAMAGISTVMGTCSGRTLAHELGHALGLRHSFWQNEAGTWRWSRGHAVENDFGTIMSYGRGGRGLGVFSDPDANCRGNQETDRPCGEDMDAVAGADAVASLDAVRFQAAAFQDGHPDTDGDGFVDPVDGLPEDPDGWGPDTDGDGIGDNADEDDDGDGVADTVDAFPLDGTESVDSDGDGIGDNGDAFPDDASEWADTDGDGVGDNGDAFPDDPGEWADTDGDGVGDNGDAFPDDPDEWADTDGDGVGDNGDPDADGDGVANEADLFPLDGEKSDIASYVFLAEAPGDRLGEALLSTGGEAPRIVVGAPGYDSGRGALYMIAVADLPAIDAADGRVDREIALGHATTGPGSWRFVGESEYDQAGVSAVSADMDGDDLADLVIGAPGEDTGGLSSGAVYLVSGADLEGADAADGESDRTVSLAHVAGQPRSWKIARSDRDRLGNSVAAADLDGDGRFELIVGAPGNWNSEHAGAVHVWRLDQLAAADPEDDIEDGIVHLANLAGRPDAYRLNGETARDLAGDTVGLVGDLDGDGNPEFGIGVPHATVGGIFGLAYLVSARDLGTADAADGEADGIVDLGRVGAQPGSWKATGSGLGRSFGLWPGGMLLGGWRNIHVVAGADLAGIDAADGAADGTVAAERFPDGANSWTLRNVSTAALVGDVDGDGSDNVLFASWQVTYLFATGTLAEFDSHDGNEDGRVDSWAIANDERTWKMGRLGQGVFPTLVGAGDVDGDGLGDLLLAESAHSDSGLRDRVYLLMGADLEVLDGADGRDDRGVRLGSVAGDTDGDGVGNTLDPDDDNDGFLDGEDAFHLDPAEWRDSDGDGVGDNADAFPEDRSEQFDTDGDGVGDRADEDDDGDGVPDDEDKRPLDTDNDGLDNRDDTDDDNDGVSDDEDDLPVDPVASVDTDGDGVPDTEDAFPFDPGAAGDTDGDGVDDSRDAFPEDAAESVDTDGDGIGNNADPDDDNDGVDDETDLFPLDADRWVLTSSLKFVPESGSDRLGAGLAGLGDLDGDGRPELLLGAPGLDPNGAAYLVSSRDLESADEADGTRDGIVAAERIALQSYSYKLLGEDGLSAGGAMFSAGDLNGDDVPEFTVGAGALIGAAFVMSGPDLLAADAQDGEADGVIGLEAVSGGAASWRLRGVWRGGLGTSIGRAPGHVLVGQPSSRARDAPGTAHLLTGPRLGVLDAADGDVDGRLNLNDSSGPWLFTGENGGDRAGAALAAGDFDADGNTDVVIGAPRHDTFARSDGAVYLVGSRDFEAGDAFELARAAAGEYSFKIVGEGASDLLGSGVAVGDVDGDGQVDLVLRTSSGFRSRAIVHVVSGTRANLLRLDAEDGNEDGLIVLGNEDRTGHWRITYPEAWWEGWGPRGNVAVVDSDGDDRSDLLVPLLGGPGRPSFALLPGVAVAADGNAGGTVPIESAAAGGYAFHAEVDDVQALRAGAAGDVDGDGREDLLLGVVSREASAGYLIFAADLAPLDAADGSRDGVIHLSSVARLSLDAEAMPLFPGAGPADRVYTVGRAIDARTLPAASGGDGELTYSLSPQVPGLRFDPDARRLSGTPTEAGNWRMSYRARDASGDADWRYFNIAVEAATGGGATTHGVGDTLTDLPTGSWTPDVTSGGSFSASAGNTTVNLNEGGYIEEGGHRYTCQSAGGCVVENRSVTSGTVVQTASGTAPGGGVADDHGDDTTTATGIQAGSDTEGVLESGDVDYFRIVVDAPGTLEAYTSSNLDTRGRLEDADGAELGTNDDGGAGLNFRIFEEVSPGTYFVRVEGYSSSVTGDYTLHVRFREGEGERAALMALYNATDGPNWAANANWGSSAPLSQWHGVSTDGNGRVTSMSLFGNQLSGSIPAELGSLSNLEELWLSGNQLSGPIPAELGNLANLTSLRLWENELSGSIPAELGNLSNLEDLALSENQLSGPIPTELGNLSNLRQLGLRGNELSGSIPAKLGNLSNLEYLGLARNQLSGPIPAELGNLANLVENLNLNYNQLSGPIPAELGNLANLEELWLSGNQLSGPIPAELGNLSNLQRLLLSGNQLSGPIPAELGNLSNLVDLGLSGNQLSGPFPAELGNLSNLVYLYLGDNQLSGPIPTELGNLSNLQWLLLSGNQLSGPIPAELGNLSNLTRLLLAGNQLSGCIPYGLRDVANNDLSDLDLAYCGDSGTPGSGQETTHGVGDTLSDLPSGSWTPDVTSGGSFSSSGGNTTVNLNEGGYIEEGGHRYTCQSSGGCVVENRRVTSGTVVQTASGTAPGSGVADDHGDDRTTATGVEAGSDTEGVLESGDVDYFRTVVDAAGTLEAYTSSDLDTRGWLEDADGAELGTNDDGGAGTNFRISEDVSPGTYYVRVEGYSSSVTGDYTLHVRFTESDSGTGTDDRAALIALFNATDGPNWRNNTNWLTDKPLAEWYGVDTDASGRVVRLILSGPHRGEPFGLTGAIPVELSSLAELRWLSLGGNELTGSIPLELGALTNLESLDLQDNYLTGAIPSWLGDLANLKRLQLEWNNLSGAIPPELENLANLKELSFHANDLSGAIPLWLGELPNLEWLSLSYNSFSGAIPPDLGNLANLEFLSLYYNSLSGTIPPELGNLSNLEWLRLSGNSLTGAIPTVLGSLTSLERLELDGNQFSGPIPAELGNLSNLVDLDLRGNQLSGPIPAELGSLSNLVSLGLGGNQLSGSIPAELGNLSNLEGLSLSSNQLSGPIPAELGRLSNLEDLRLNSNQLSGPIPAVLSNLSNLEHLLLAGNQLSGCIPDGLRDVADNDLSDLDLAYCGDSGTPGGGDETTHGVGDTLTDLPTGSWTPDVTSGGSFSLSAGNATVRLDDGGYIEEGGHRYTCQSSGGCVIENRSVTSGTVVQTASGTAPGGGVSGDHGDDRATATEVEAGSDTEGVLESGDVDYFRIVVDAAGTLEAYTSSDLDTRGWLEDADGAELGTNDDGGAGTNFRISEDVSPGTYFVRVEGFSSGITGAYTLHARFTESDSGTATGDRPALMALYNATDGPNWANNANWGSDSPLESWHGVTTDDNGRVTRIDLRDNQLSGPIPVELGSLSNLEDLLLDRNQLSGPIPVELGSLSNLEQLFLYRNQLGGPIPAELGNLANLEVLSLSENELSGSIPAELGNLANLEVLSLSENELSGSIPAELGNLSNLRQLTLSYNQLSGPIPAELVRLSNLEELWLLSNQLSGPIPAELGNLSNLRQLTLSHNQLSGPIPAELVRLSNLELLWLGSNELSGPIPAELGNLSNLRQLSLGHNQLSGPIPAELGNLSNLGVLSLRANDLSGPIPAELGSLSNLNDLALSHNQLSGPIPPELGNLSNLENLWLRSNDLTGPIPAELGGLSNLQWLWLSGNQLSGCIPDGLRDVADNDLSDLDLAYCGDSGTPGGGQETTHGVGDTLSDLPTGDWFADVTSGGTFVLFGGKTTVLLDEDGYIEKGSYRFTCQSSGGCVIEDRRVTSGTVVQTASGTAPGEGTGQGPRPSFPAGSGPGDQSYTVGTAIAALTLPEASGGDGPLTYSLSPAVPGLIFNATRTVRRLTGTPSAAGTYDMTYRVRDIDGDTDSLTFTITVTEPVSGPDLVG